MFFEQDTINFTILRVNFYQQKHSEKPLTFSERLNYYELSYRLQSKSIIETEENTYELADDVISFFPAEMNYKRYASYDTLIVIHFKYYGNKYRSFEAFKPLNPKPFKEKFIKILDIWDKKETGYKMYASALMLEILADIHKEIAHNKPADVIDNGIAYINANFRCHDLNIKSIADICYVSEQYFRKLFRKRFGMSPKKYITNMRINYAAEMIDSGFYPLAAISEMSGYTDYRHFSVAFKKAMGYSPSKYYNRSNQK